MADAGQETTTSSEFEVVGDAEQVAQVTDQAQPAEQPLQISEASLARARLEESVLSHVCVLHQGSCVCVLRTC